MKPRLLLLPLAGIPLAILIWRHSLLPARGKEAIPESRVQLARRLEGFYAGVGRLVGLENAPSIPRRIGIDSRKYLQGQVQALREKLSYERSAWNLSDLAVLELLTDDPERAVSHLEAAVIMAPQDARLRSDLSAAYLTRARKRRSALDAMRGLALANKAHQLDPSLPEAVFNRAAALELLCLTDSARSAWADYLLLDSNSSWAGEVRVRREGLKKPSETSLWNAARRKLLAMTKEGGSDAVVEIVKRFSQPVQVFAQEVLLPDWASAVAAGESQRAEEIRVLLTRIGGVLAECDHDYEIADAATGLRHASLDSGEHALVVGYKFYTTGRSVQLQHRPQEAALLLAKSSEQLARVGSPIAYWAKLYEVVALMDLHRIDQAISEITHLTQQADQHRYRSLAGKIAWIRGMLLFKNSQPALALDSFLKAVDSYQAISAWEDLCASHFIAAETLEYLGNSEGASAHLWESLSLFPKLINAWRLFSILDELADSAQEEGFNDIALMFRGEVVKLVNGSDDPVGLAHALRRRAETLMLMKRFREARKDSVQLQAVVKNISDFAERREFESATALTLGESWLSEDPHRALSFLKTSQRFYSASGDQYELPRVYRAEHDAYQGLRDTKRAEEAIEAGIAWYERQDALANVNFGPTFASRLGEMFDTAIREKLAGGEPLSALHYAERRRVIADVVLNRQDSHNLSRKASVISIESIQRAMPQDDYLIVYVILREKLAVWRIDRDHAWFREFEEGAQQIAPVIQAYYRSLADQRALATRRRLLSDLYASLLAPVLSGVPSGANLIIVPSGVLAQVPFSAATNQKTDRYLIQDFSVRISPSVLQVLRKVPRRGRTLAVKRLGVLAVGGPKLDRRILVNLPDLRFAVIEAERVRALYPRGVVLAGEDATKAEVLREISRFPVVHLSAHSLSNGRFPARSLIALSPGSDADGGLLHPAEIAAQDLSSVSLAVLGVCRSAAGERQVESFNLVEPFLSAGVGSVIASLWDVEDSYGLRFLPLIHAEIVKGEDPTSALRSAQLAMLSSNDVSIRDPGQWASFEIFGD